MTLLIGFWAILGTAIADDDISVASRDASFLLRGTKDASLGTNPGRSLRRLIKVEQECIIYIAGVEYMKEQESGIILDDYDVFDDETQFYSEEVWYCKFDTEYAREELNLDDPFIEIKGILNEGFETDSVHSIGRGFITNTNNTNNELDEIFKGIQSGKSTIKFSRGIVDCLDNSLHIDLTSASIGDTNETYDADNTTDPYSVSGTDLIRGSPEIEPKVGEKTTLVVRITTNDYKYEPAVSKAAIKQFVYDNPVSLKGKYEECSYNKLKILPFEGTTKTDEVVSDGIVDVRLSKDQSNEVKRYLRNKNGNVPRGKMTSFARTAAAIALGDLESQFDFVMFCLPEGVTGFLAVAVLNRFDSYYTSEWCTRPSFQVHEVGHNLGLDHAGEAQTYDDKVGFMGFSYNQMDGPNMCFNPANNYFLGWYTEQVYGFDGLKSGRGKTFILNGVSDYDPSPNPYMVVLKLIQADRDWDYYIGYNRKSGMNSGTEEDGDMILVLQKYGSPGSSSKTRKIGTLIVVGDYMTLSGYNNRSNVYLQLTSLSRDGKDAYITVSTFRPTRPPTQSPTPAPTMADRTNLKYKGNARRGCTWIAKKPEVRCGFNSRKKSVQDHWCPATCHNVVVQNDCNNGSNKPDRDDLVYKNDEEKGCSWILERRKRRCSKKWRGEKISTYWCPTSCKGYC